MYKCISLSKISSSCKGKRRGVELIRGTYLKMCGLQTLQSQESPAPPALNYCNYCGLAVEAYISRICMA